MQIARAITTRHSEDIVVAHIELNSKGEYVDQDGVFVTNKHKLDLDAIKAAIPNFDPKVGISFYIDTYDNLDIKRPPERWGETFRPANDFLMRLNDYDATRFYIFFARARQRIHEQFEGSDFVPAVNEIADYLSDLCEEIDLCHKLLEYVVVGRLPIPDLSNVGTRPQDTSNLTFDHSNFIRLTAISVLCKLICPIWGDLIYRTRSKVEDAEKESHCAEIIAPVLNHIEFKFVNDKLEYYIENSINRQINPEFEFTAVFAGFSRSRLCHNVYSMILVKKFVNLDVLRPDSNIMTYVLICAEKSLTARANNISRKTNIRPRLDINESHGEDDNNVSLLEHGSITTTCTADIPVLMKFSVNLTIDRLIDKYHISRSAYNDCLKYYQKNVVTFNLLNRSLVQIMFGTDIGGSRSVKFLDAECFTKLVTIAQIYIATKFRNNIARFLTAYTPAQMKTTSQTVNDSRIGFTWNTPYEYRNIISKFPYTVGNSSAEKYFENIRDFIINYDHIANTAPYIEDIIDDDIRPVYGTILPYDDMIFKEFLRVVADTLERSSLQAAE